MISKSKFRRMILQNEALLVIRLRGSIGTCQVLSLDATYFINPSKMFVCFYSNYYFYRFTDENDRKTGFRERPSTSSISSASSIEEEPAAKPKPRKDAPKALTSLLQIGDYLEKHVAIEDRKYRLKTYKQCFIGSQAVSILMDAGCCANRAQAVDIGRQLAKQLNLFEHVAGRDVRDLEE